MGERRFTIVTYDCPGCGASIKINPGQMQVTCEYCGNSFEIESEREKEREREQEMQRAAREGAARAAQQRDQQNRVNLRNKVIIIVAVVGVVLMMGSIITVELIASLVGAAAERQYKESVVDKNPYENITVRMKGKEPWAEIEGISGDSKLYGLEYSADKTSGLSNGDVITIQAKALRGYRWTEDSYQYTVSGLDSIVTELNQLDEETRKNIYEECQKEIERDWEDGLENCDITVEDIQLTIQPYKMYLNVNKEEGYSFYPANNVLMISFETTFTHEGKTQTVYQYVAVDEVYWGSDGILHGEFDKMDATRGYLYSQTLGFDEYFSVSGYESAFKMESSMEEDSYRLKKE